MRAIIVCNGSVEEDETYEDVRQADDLVIAANGGTMVALDLGLQPKAVVGDMDSLPPETRMELAERGCQFVSHPRRKDETDTELAIRYALQAGAEEIVFLGATGDRLDHTLANILLLAMPQLERVPATIVASNTQLWLLRAGSQLEFGGDPGDIVTLLPLGQDAVGVSTDGLEWTLHDDTLHFGAARGVSNLMTADHARVALRQGLLLVLRLAQGETAAAKAEETDKGELVQVYAAQGHMRANVIKARLEAAGIRAMLSYESLGRIYGLTVNGIGQVRILVRSEDEAEARRILEEEPPQQSVEA